MKRCSPVSRRTRLESLEPRRLFAIVFDPSGIGTVTVTGTDGPDTIRAERVGTDDVRFTLNSTVQTFDMDDFGTIDLQGLGGNDNITLVGGDDFRNTFLFLDGGAGGIDTLSSNGPFAFLRNGEILRDNVRTVATRQSDGTLAVTGTAGDDAIELRRGTEGAELHVNAFSAHITASEYAAFSVAGLGGNDTIRIDSGFRGSADRAVAVSGDAGNDTFEIEHGAGAAVTGGEGNDTLRVLLGMFDDGLVGVESFAGGAGTDTIDMTGQHSLNLNLYPDVENVTNATGAVSGNALPNRITATLDPDPDIDDNVFRGGAGNDTLIGSNDPDQLFGDANDDTLVGNDGNDLLDGGDGTDSGDGGAGDDTLVSIESGPGQGGDDPGDAVPGTVDAGPSRVRVTGTSGNDTIRVERVGTDDVRITINSLVQTFDMDEVGGDYSIRGLGGNDSVTVRGAIERVGLTIDGDSGTDTLSADQEALYIEGEFMRDGAGSLVVELDPLEGYIVHGTAGDDHIQLHEFGDGPLVRRNSTFIGLIPGMRDAGHYYVFAGGGNDRITVGSFFPGRGQLHGQEGNDTFDLEPQTLSDVFGGANDDTLFARGENFDHVARFEAAGGVDTIQFDQQVGLSFDTLEALDWENATNARGTVFGTGADNRIVADPTDTVGVEFRGGEGNDTLIGGAGPDDLFGDEGDDNLTGNAGNDFIDGGADFDTADGGTGTNTIVNVEQGGGGGGGDQADAFIADDPSGVPTLFVDGTGGNDTIRVDRVGSDDVRVNVNNGALVRTFDTDNFDRIVLTGAAGNDTITVGTGVGDVEMDGGTGNDTLVGAEGNDTLFGNEGDDTITGNAGHDEIIGGNGTDVGIGGAGRDAISAEDTRDGTGQPSASIVPALAARALYVEGTDGNDTLGVVRVGGDDVRVTANGVVLGTFDLDNFEFIILEGNRGNDTITAGPGIPIEVFLLGEDGDDNLTGGDGTDNLDGGNGNDTLRGNAGGDFLRGGDGNDTIFARDGRIDEDVDGGVGFDRAQIDEGLDDDRGIEELIP